MPLSDGTRLIIFVSSIPTSGSATIRSRNLSKNSAIRLQGSLRRKYSIPAEVSRTPWFLLRKSVGLVRGLDYEMSDATLSPDWVAGMFMLFRRNVYAEVGGFDERYFLYYEDVDLCRRLRRHRYDVRLLPEVSVVHDARRESRHSLRHLGWHLSSMLRYFLIRTA